MVAPLKERAAAALWFGLVEPLADVSGRLGRLSDEVGQVILFMIFGLAERRCNRNRGADAELRVTDFEPSGFAAQELN